MLLNLSVNICRIFHPLPYRISNQYIGAYSFIINTILRQINELFYSVYNYPYFLWAQFNEKSVVILETVLLSVLICSKYAILPTCQVNIIYVPIYRCIGNRRTCFAQFWNFAWDFSVIYKEFLPKGVVKCCKRCN